MTETLDIEVGLDSTSASAEGPIPQPADSRARDELRRILDSPGFSVPQRSRRVLEYIVTETLAGRGHRLKAYSIATEVLRRPASFDPQRDPIVRIEAARLRRELERYYFTAGADDHVVISIPKGGYIPHFAFRSPTRASRAHTHEVRTGERWIGTPKILALLLLGVVAAALAVHAAVNGRLAIKQAGDPPRIVIRKIVSTPATAGIEAIAEDLTGEVVQQMSHYGELLAVEVGNDSSARYELTGVLDGRESSGFQLLLRAATRDKGTVLWADRVALDQISLGISLQTIAEQVAIKLAAPYGVVFQAERKLLAELPPKSLTAYACKIAYYSYRAELSPESHPSVRDCLSQVGRGDPADATVRAMLSLVTIDEIRYGFPPPEDAIQSSLYRALDQARAAIKLDPANARGAEALMMSLTFAGDSDAALEIGGRAAQRHPEDLELQGEYGHRLALNGQWIDGCARVEKVQGAGNMPPTYFQAILSLCGYFTGDLKGAVALIQQATGTGNPFHHVIAAAVFAEAGLADRAMTEVDWLRVNAAGLLPSLRRELTFRIRRSEDSQKFIESLERAGLELP